MIGGVAVVFQEFQKMGCGVALPEPGYHCGFRYQSRPLAYSNDPSPEAQRQAAGITVLMQVMSGFRESRGVADKRNFIKTGDRWYVTPDST